MTHQTAETTMTWSRHNTAPEGRITPVRHAVRLLAACAAAGLLLFAPSPAGAVDYFVSPSGSDTNPGTIESPFRTLGRAVQFLGPGDTCYLRAGTYRERVRLTRSGLPGLPIRITRWRNERVVLSGTEIVSGPWEAWERGIFRTRLDFPVTQLFARGKMMIEARWPNVNARTRWTRASWAKARKGSTYGKIYDPALAATGIDWTGATAILNVAHQFLTWTQPVVSHGMGQPSFTYAKELSGIGDTADNKKAWWDDYYILSGKLEALDAPGEWFQDDTHLYFKPQKSMDIQNVVVEGKVRELALQGKNLQHVIVSGLQFFGATVRFEDSSYLQVQYNHFLYPTYNRHLPPDTNGAKYTQVSGTNNIVRGNFLRFSYVGGIFSRGEDNLIENNIVWDSSMLGSLTYVAIEVAGEPVGTTRGSVVRGNTVFNGGSTLIRFKGAPHIVEGNHVYNGGLLSKDISLIYTSEPETWGSIVRYNWIHGVWSEGGIGIRGDDQTRGLTVHHNVVWDCSDLGLEIKGDRNRIFNNTVFAIGDSSGPGYGLLLYRGPEPYKPWLDQAPLLPEQNKKSKVRNNALISLTAEGGKLPKLGVGRIRNNHIGGGMKLMDPAAYDFRPTGKSPLVDAGEIIPRITAEFSGPAPDIGAYENGLELWVPGAVR
jgi:hypothetical protein